MKYELPLDKCMKKKCHHEEKNLKIQMTKANQSKPATTYLIYKKYIENITQRANIIVKVDHKNEEIPICV